MRPKAHAGRVILLKYTDALFKIVFYVLLLTLHHRVTSYFQIARVKKCCCLHADERGASMGPQVCPLDMVMPISMRQVQVALWEWCESRCHMQYVENPCLRHHNISVGIPCHNVPARSLHKRLEFRQQCQQKGTARLPRLRLLEMRDFRRLKKNSDLCNQLRAEEGYYGHNFNV